jgi:hypothetical protein
MSTKSRRVQEGRGIGTGISIAINKPRGENTTLADDVQIAQAIGASLFLSSLSRSRCNSVHLRFENIDDGIGPSDD